MEFRETPGGNTDRAPGEISEKTPEKTPRIMKGLKVEIR